MDVAPGDDVRVNGGGAMQKIMRKCLWIREKVVPLHADYYQRVAFVALGMCE